MSQGETSDLPSAAEALRSAVAELRAGNIGEADTWVMVARELRAGARSGAEEWKQRAYEQRAEAERWRGAYESLHRQCTERWQSEVREQRADYLAETAHPVSAPLFDATAAADFGTTMAGDPAYAGETAGARIYRLHVDEIDETETLAQILHQDTQLVSPLPRTFDKLAVPVPRPADVRFGEEMPRTMDEQGVCDRCRGYTYQATIGDTQEIRHRETGTHHCPPGSTL
jgi:hypothetical protein